MTEGNIELKDEIGKLMTVWKQVSKWLQNLPDDTSRFLGFFAWLNSYLEEKGYGRIIIVGGFAVEIYTGSTYRTLDVDIIVEGSRARKIVEEFIRTLSEEPTSRVYMIMSPLLASKAVDVVGSYYVSGKPPVKISIDKYHVYVEPPEELIVKYLSAWKYWRSEEDRDKVLILYRSLKGRLDLDYVRSRARSEGVEDLLRKLVEE